MKTAQNNILKSCEKPVNKNLKRQDNLSVYFKIHGLCKNREEKKLVTANFANNPIYYPVKKYTGLKQKHCCYCYYFCKYILSYNRRSL